MRTWPFASIRAHTGALRSVYIQAMPPSELTRTTRLSGHGPASRASHAKSVVPVGAPVPEINVCPFGRRSASLGATTEVGPGAAFPSPNDQTILPVESTSMTRLLNWSAMTTFPSTAPASASFPRASAAASEPPSELPSGFAVASEPDEESGTVAPSWPVDASDAPESGVPLLPPPLSSELQPSAPPAPRTPNASTHRTVTCRYPLFTVDMALLSTHLRRNDHRGAGHDPVR